MTGLTRNFRASRSSAGSAGDSPSTCGDVGVPRFSFISENIVRLHRFLALLTLHFGTPQGFYFVILYLSHDWFVVESDNFEWEPILKALPQTSCYQLKCSSECLTVTIWHAVLKKLPVALKRSAIKAPLRVAYSAINLTFSHTPRGS